MSRKEMELINVWQYWHGDRNDTVKRLEKTVETAYSKERGYDYHRLTDDDIPKDIIALYDTCRTENVSDVIRYYLLYNYGGVWFDSDMAIRDIINFPNLLKMKEIGITANQKKNQTWASTCILACNKGCFLFKKMLDSSLDTLHKHGRNCGYADVGPVLVTKIMNYHKHKWVQLPKVGYPPQFFNDRIHDYRKFTNMFQFDKPVYGDSWTYTHFCGGNLRWWNSVNMAEGNVMGDTVARCERDLGYTYER